MSPAGSLNRLMLTFPCIKTLERSDSCRAQEPLFAMGTRWEFKKLIHTWRYVTRYKVLGWVNNGLGSRIMHSPSAGSCIITRPRPLLTPPSHFISRNVPPGVLIWCITLLCQWYKEHIMWLFIIHFPFLFFPLLFPVCLLSRLLQLCQMWREWHTRKKCCHWQRKLKAQRNCCSDKNSM